jgi:hypothetical protein
MEKQIEMANELSHVLKESNCVWSKQVEKLDLILSQLDIFKTAVPEIKSLLTSHRTLLDSIKTLEENNLAANESMSISLKKVMESAKSIEDSMGVRKGVLVMSKLVKDELAKVILDPPPPPSSDQEKKHEESVRVMAAAGYSLAYRVESSLDHPDSTPPDPNNPFPTQKGAPLTHELSTILEHPSLEEELPAVGETPIITTLEEGEVKEDLPETRNQVGALDSSLKRAREDAEKEANADESAGGESEDADAETKPRKKRMRKGSTSSVKPTSNVSTRSQGKGKSK